MKKADIKNLSAGDLQNKLAEAQADFTKLNCPTASAQLKIQFKLET
jgi:LSU ribosomal protein L29P